MVKKPSPALPTWWLIHAGTFLQTPFIYYLFLYLIQYHSSAGNSFIVTIEDKLYERLLSLPRVMRSMNDDQKLISLNIVLGYFNLMGKQLSKVFNSITMLEKIMKSFIQVRCRFTFVLIIFYASVCAQREGSWSVNILGGATGKSEKHTVPKSNS